MLCAVFRSWMSGTDNRDPGDRSARAECVFCQASKRDGEEILAQSSSWLVIRDHKPAAKEHLLVLSRQHIQSVKSLTKEDISLVRDMEAAARRTLSDLGAPEDTHIYGFHIPPFNSVNHLHLHAFGTPFKSALRKAKYPRSGPLDGHKGWSWFIQPNQVIRALETGRTVSFRPS